MDYIIEFLIELLGGLLEFSFENMKNPRKRAWVLTVFYFVLLLGFTAFCGYSAITFGKENNTAGTIVMGVIAGAVCLVFVFLIVHGHRQNWKKR